MREQKSLFGKIDWITVTLYLVLVMLGWINIYAAVYDESHSSILDISQRYGKQLIWIGAAILLAFTLLLIDPKFFNAFAYVIYGLALFTLVVVLLIGREIAGSKSWFEIGSFAIQPAEFAKFATALALARFLSAHNTDFSKLKDKFWSLLIIFAPAVLILLQNDTGSAIVYVALILVLYREGLNSSILMIGVVVVVLFILTLLLEKFLLMGILLALTAIFYFYMKRNRHNLIILASILLLVTGFVFSVDYAFDHVLESHQKTRINVLLGKQIDLKGAGYNVNQSMIAIGSGGFTGKGFLKGTQTKYNFVPEQSTDFIFCTVGEEWGFIGSFVVIALFVALLSRLIIMAERQRSPFSRIYGYAVASILFFHFAVNIGMTIGLMPVIGIPLPFFSYGGSSLWSFTILLFIFIKQDANRLELL